ncbi:hypothetical protein ES703_62301 [subsurface metagenome]
MVFTPFAFFHSIRGLTASIKSVLFGVIINISILGLYQMSSMELFIELLREENPFKLRVHQITERKMKKQTVIGDFFLIIGLIFLWWII